MKADHHTESKNRDKIKILGLTIITATEIHWKDSIVDWCLQEELVKSEDSSTTKCNLRNRERKYKE